MLKTEIKTPYDLKMFYQSENPNGHFFDRKTMSFFGDTMKNYGLRDAGDCWELYRRRPVKAGLSASAFFNKETFSQCWRSKAA